MTSINSVPGAELQAHRGQHITFGPFLLSPAQRLLLRVDKPVNLGSRAWEILLMLVERAGDVVRKRELMERVWPDIAVEEGTLRVHVSDLRKALGDGQQGIRYIENVTGRGYRFVAPLIRADKDAPQHRAGASIEDPTRILIELLRHAQMLIELEGGEEAAAATRLLSRLRAAAAAGVNGAAPDSGQRMSPGCV